MPPANQRRMWLALSLSLGGLLAMGSLVLPRAALLARVFPVRSVTATATATPWPSATPSATATATPSATDTPPPTATSTPIPPPTATQEPTPAPDGQARTVRLPILMYHYISDLPADADAYRTDLSVSPARFEAQLAYLKEQGYTSISLEDLALYLTAGRPLPPKPIILTFDDGYLDNYLYAFPLLRQYGFQGAFFIVTQFVDGGGERYLNWEQARLMQENGMEIEAHGVSHEDLRGQPAAFVEQQIAEARRAIEDHLHKPVRFFCYPYGRYDSRTVAALRAAGYTGAVTTEGGAVHTTAGLFELARVRVHGYYGLDKFVETLDYYLR